MTKAEGRKTVLVILAILMPMLLLFFYLGKEDMGMTVFMVLAAIMFAIRYRWDLRKHIWFWAVIVFILALHVPLFFIVRWPPHVAKLSVLPIVVADYLIVVGAARFVEKFIVKPATKRDATQSAR